MQKSDCPFSMDVAIIGDILQCAIPEILGGKLLEKLLDVCFLLLSGFIYLYFKYFSLTKKHWSAFYDGKPQYLEPKWLTLKNCGLKKSFQSYLEPKNNERRRPKRWDIQYCNERKIPNEIKATSNSKILNIITKALLDAAKGSRIKMSVIKIKSRNIFY